MRDKLAGQLTTGHHAQEDLVLHSFTYGVPVSLLVWGGESQHLCVQVTDVLHHEPAFSNSCYKCNGICIPITADFKKFFRLKIKCSM